MKNTEKNYFTPGELAKLTGISKQILLYYDKNNIFSPSFVDDNGYSLLFVIPIFFFRDIDNNA